MTQIIFIVSLLVLLSMFGIKILEEKRGKEFAFSLWLASFDDHIVPRIRAFFIFLRGNGNGSLRSTLLFLLRKVSGLIGVMFISIQKKIKELQHSSRGQYSLKNNVTNSHFLKQIAEHKNGKSDKKEE